MGNTYRREKRLKPRNQPYKKNSNFNAKKIVNNFNSMSNVVEEEVVGIIDEEVEDLTLEEKQE